MLSVKWESVDNEAEESGKERKGQAGDGAVVAAPQAGPDCTGSPRNARSISKPWAHTQAPAQGWLELPLRGTSKPRQGRARPPTPPSQTGLVLVTISTLRTLQATGLQVSVCCRNGHTGNGCLPNATSAFAGKHHRTARRGPDKHLAALQD
ncbi:uncharacterized protein B0I36DRAFT_348389 [Microdochium trichocladiopsis]|uniref:Uncharacterized protein n=1 Tax=Microdochium trichocladiopsis TaxID=1682393 RepID=A0A9P8Y905_9PEZI|nr:uncharacterized protein B0I36DRAFT_348389 [Microdochium trichocladiopsis]KAH7033317.1 hypothetical protein B0I36DRAFT_348389 [Microdochium trichocladiopsis]